MAIAVCPQTRFVEQHRRVGIDASRTGARDENNCNQVRPTRPAACFVHIGQRLVMKALGQSGLGSYCGDSIHLLLVKIVRVEGVLKLPNAKTSTKFVWPSKMLRTVTRSNHYPSSA